MLNGKEDTMKVNRFLELFEADEFVNVMDYDDKSITRGTVCDLLKEKLTMLILSVRIVNGEIWITIK